MLEPLVVQLRFHKVLYEIINTLVCFEQDDFLEKCEKKQWVKQIFQKVSRCVQNESRDEFSALRVFPAVTWLTVYRLCPVRNQLYFEFKIPATLQDFEIIFESSSFRFRLHNYSQFFSQGQ